MGHKVSSDKSCKRRVKKLKEAEMEVDGEVLQEESVEIRSPKRKVIRVESGETQDHVRETLAITQEEAEEICFVPSALSEPRRPIYWCDNRCSEKAVRRWRIASMVVEEGGAAHTINLCQQCCNEKLVQQGKPRLKLWQWNGVVEKKVHRGRIWNVMGNEQFVRGGRFSRKTRLVATGIAFQRGLGPSQEKCGCMMRQGYLAMENGSWEYRKEENKSSD